MDVDSLPYFSFAYSDTDYQNCNKKLSKE